MGWHDWGWWMSLHGLIPLLIVVGGITGMVVLIRILRGLPRHADRSRAILDERYARGEIDREEYLAKRQDLS